jgi:uncharacterized protein (DUF362 family)
LIVSKNSKQPAKSALYTRRHFLKHSALTAFGVAAARKLSPALDGLFPAESPAEKSRVILVRHSGVVDADGRVQGPLLQEILDKAIIEFSGRSAVADAWRQFVSPEDVVGFKINTLGLTEVRGTDYTHHFSAMIEAVASGLRRAGVKDKNMVVWDRSEEEMMEAGLTIQKDPGAMRVIANKAGRRDPGDYAPRAYPVGGLSSRVSRILADVCTTLINIPVPKTHGNSVFTCSLKNHYGSIDNPSRMHANACCDPGIAEVNAIPVIREKQKLVVSDALLLVTERGPRWDRRFIRPYGGVIIGTDPVAVDAVALKILDDKRAEDGMDRIAPRVPHVALAEKLALGKSRLEDIDLVALDLG